MDETPATPYTKLKRGETVIKQGFCGLGAGSRGKTFAPGRLYLTDRRLIVESRLETDRSTVIIALAAVTEVEPLPDGVVLSVAQGDELTRETIIIWGEAAPWVKAIEAGRQDAPALRAPLQEGRMRTATEKRRRTVIFGVAGVVGGMLLLIALCILAAALWVALQGGSP